MRKLSFMIMVVIILTAAIIPSASAAEAEDERLDLSKLDKGAIGIRYDAPAGKVTKAVITKGANSYTYSLDKAKATKPIWLPLQMGNGAYSVVILENVTKTKYRAVLSKSVTVKVPNGADIYLHSIQHVNWMDAKKTAAKAKELTRNSKTDEEKAKAIYQYIISNVKYDFVLAKKLTDSAYIPDIDATLAASKGVCYNFASLYAAMLRSEGIPAKLVMGTTSQVDGYHAWNEVYLNGKWVLVDTTVDTGLKKSEKPFTFAKSAKDYKVEKTY
ncbi:transglutaminase-like domain-containing protein [Paenibacillus spongiae]|uniref:Transglutaminase-like domain-containing protein n=1 Tax=Paenibacillus spongiae TaxID=2909671 RepID=A0ABY5S384_9BACL|nr:transglutaminase-like domain-containing protein [Paenibacillus spongiae]UVI28352.1 transglutaminase-like domain-containing protein [Paenibacillus spongiae]